MTFNNNNNYNYNNNKLIILYLKIVLNIKLYHLHTPMELPQQQEHKHTEHTEDYIKQLTPFEESAYKIAKSHLGTSFNLKKSNGYLKWIGKK